jgi:hypothetical protein
VRPHVWFQYVDVRRLIKVLGGGSRGHKPSCLRGGNSCVCFNAVVERRASLVVRGRYNLILNLAGVAIMAAWIVPPIVFPIFIANFCLRAECYLLVIFQGVFGVRSVRLAIRSHDHHMS